MLGVDVDVIVGVVLVCRHGTDMESEVPRAIDNGVARVGVPCEW